jgi:hypothetical protein
MNGLDEDNRNAIADCCEVIRSRKFSCAGAKAALAGDALEFVLARDLRSGADDTRIVEALHAFHSADTGDYKSLAILFPQTPALSEQKFERFLWQRLQALHVIDHERHPWDPAVSDDPASASFGFSVGEQAFYVVGMHPAASRMSRRMPFAVLAFNTHAQFRRLRANGKFARMQSATRARDIALQGSPNPMLADHGVKSEARQYSGRALAEQWVCPFQPRANPGKTA